jgi:surface protein
MDISRVTNMRCIFTESVFNSDISQWDTSAITCMESAFSYNTKFNVDISLWNTSAVLDMSDMFHGAESFNKSLGKWDVINMRSMVLVDLIKICNYGMSVMLIMRILYFKMQYVSIAQ